MHPRLRPTLLSRALCEGESHQPFTARSDSAMPCASTDVPALAPNWDGWDDTFEYRVRR